MTKLHVLALREIVADTGADRGILLAECGAQSGAVEAATLTNVHISSLADTRATTISNVYSMRLRELYDRNEVCKEEYWDIPKDKRIQHGLRYDIGDFGYSGARVIDYVDDLLRQAFRGTYPVEPDRLLSMCAQQSHTRFQTIQDLVVAVDSLISELEDKLRIFRRADPNA